MVRSTHEFMKRESDCPISPPNSGLSGYFVSRCCAMRKESWIVSSPSTRIGTLSCLLNAIAALSLTRTGL